MAIPSSGPISLTDVQTEFGGSNPIGINEYYAGGGLVPAGTSGTYGAVPSSGTISLQNFYGTSAVVYFFGQLASSKTPNYTGAGYGLGFPIALNNNLVLFNGPNNGSKGQYATSLVTVNTATGAINYVKYLDYGCQMFSKGYDSATDTLYFLWSDNNSPDYQPGPYIQLGKISGISTSTPTLVYFKRYQVAGVNNPYPVRQMALGESSNIYCALSSYYSQIIGYNCCGPIYVQVQIPAFAKILSNGNTSWTRQILPGGVGLTYVDYYAYVMNIFVSTAPYMYLASANYFSGGFAISSCSVDNVTQSFFQYQQTSGTVGTWTQGSGCTDNAGNVYYVSAGVGNSYKLSVAKVNPTTPAGTVAFAILFSVTGMSTSQNAWCLWGTDGYLYVAHTSYVTYGNGVAVYKISSTGVMQWAKYIAPTFQTSSNDYNGFQFAPIQTLTQDSSNIYISFAEIRTVSSTQNSATFIAKISKSGSLAAQTVSFSGGGSNFSSGYYNLAVTALSTSALNVTANTTARNVYAGRDTPTVYSPLDTTFTLSSSSTDSVLQYAKANT